VRAPLQEALLAKWEVRLIAKALGLPNWDRPQNACLASRIPHGQEVTVEKLAVIERAEAAVRLEGFRQVRVRHRGREACVEVGVDELPRLADERLRSRLIERICGCGFSNVEFDPAGYHSSDSVLQQAGTTPS
jgi:uncharacterized protein